MTGTIVLIYF